MMTWSIFANLVFGFTQVIIFSFGRRWLHRCRGSEVKAMDLARVRSTAVVQLGLFGAVHWF